VRLPNTRVQRTRSSPSALRSPLTRSPLGRSALPAVLMTLWMLLFVVGFTSAPVTPAKADRPVPVDVKCENLEEPKLVHRVEPGYPEYIRRQKWEGKVELSGIIGTDGRVSDLKVRSSPGKSLSDLAIAAVSQWQYKPAYCKDLEKPVRVYITFTTSFTLNQR
jgi:TonB family protein